MRKSRIGKKIYDVVTPEEYIEADKANPEASQNLMDDTAIMDNGYVYPLNKQYSKNNPGVTDCGPMLVFSHPDSMNADGDYKADHIIDFNDVNGIRDSIRKQAELEREEASILVSPDNIFTPVIKETDTPEMKLLKEAISRKRIDLDSYKQRFGSDYNNDKRLFDQSSITFFKLKRLCDIMDIKVTLKLEDEPGAVNPIGEALETQITTDSGNDKSED